MVEKWARSGQRERRRSDHRPTKKGVALSFLIRTRSEGPSLWDSPSGVC